MSQETAWVMISKSGRIVDGTNAETKEGSAYLAVRRYWSYANVPSGGEMLEYAKGKGYTFEQVTVIPKGFHVVPDYGAQKEQIIEIDEDGNVNPPGVQIRRPI